MTKKTFIIELINLSELLRVKKIKLNLNKTMLLHPI